ncbi:hypothetical protein CEY04_28410 [Achromobacter sp. HZ28]|nr:hypothetical protein CEY05_29580 [Achromobacter sp. HZ34]OWT70014.1 hypothetical protein CEY04_28410 [Achromobacter sp. HZ28]
MRGRGREVRLNVLLRRVRETISVGDLVTAAGGRNVAPDVLPGAIAHFQRTASLRPRASRMGFFSIQVPPSIGDTAGPCFAR